MNYCPCGTAFKPKQPNQKYCCWEHYYEEVLKRAREWNKKYKVRKFPQQGKCKVCGAPMVQNRAHHAYCPKDECQKAKWSFWTRKKGLGTGCKRGQGGKYDY